MISDAVLLALRDTGLDPEMVVDVVARALDEDLGGGPDVTATATIPAATLGRADAVPRRAGVIAGLAVAAYVFEVVGSGRLRTEALVPDGARVDAGQPVLAVRGPVRDIVTGERTALNLLGHLSGIATLTRSWVDAVAGTGAVVRDTRKTTPGLRALEKYAVRCGGGTNHRMSLSDAALIKDNHVTAAGGAAAAFDLVRRYLGTNNIGAHNLGDHSLGDHNAGDHNLGAQNLGAQSLGDHSLGDHTLARRPAPAVPIEVEVDTIAQCREAVDAGAELVLLDNMAADETGLADMRVCVEYARAGGARTEASGGLTIERARAVAETGVDFIAVGALTHSAPVLDIGLDLVGP